MLPGTVRPFVVLAASIFFFFFFPREFRRRRDRPGSLNFELSSFALVLATLASLTFSYLARDFVLDCPLLFSPPTVGFFWSLYKPAPDFSPFQDLAPPDATPD